MAITHNDGPLRKSATGILDFAYGRFGREGRPIYDRYGKIGYDLGDSILVAKPNPYGYIVSCNSFLVKDKDIIFYIGRSDAFYVFKPIEILAHPQTFSNKRGPLDMLNFSIRLGKRLKEGSLCDR